MSKEQRIESVAYGLLAELPDWCDASNNGDLWEKALAFATDIVEKEGHLSLVNLLLQGIEGFVWIVEDLPFAYQNADGEVYLSSIIDAEWGDVEWVLEPEALSLGVHPLASDFRMGNVSRAEYMEALEAFAKSM